MHSERIVLDPAILVGKPIIKGTRLSVELIIGLLASGWTHEELFESYPGLTEEDIRACLHFAHEMLETQRFYPTPAR